jgi:hypothetical protein
MYNVNNWAFTPQQYNSKGNTPHGCSFILCLYCHGAAGDGNKDMHTNMISATAGWLLAAVPHPARSRRVIHVKTGWASQALLECTSSRGHTFRVWAGHVQRWTASSRLQQARGACWVTWAVPWCKPRPHCMWRMPTSKPFMRGSD